MFCRHTNYNYCVIIDLSNETQATELAESSSQIQSHILVSERLSDTNSQEDSLKVAATAELAESSSQIRSHILVSERLSDTNSQEDSPKTVSEIKSQLNRPSRKRGFNFRIMRKYHIINKDGHGTFMLAISAESETSAKEYARQNFGLDENTTFFIRDVTNEHIIDIEAVDLALRKAGFDRLTTGFITSALLICKVAEQSN